MLLERCNLMGEIDIRKYATLMKELDLTALEIKEEGKSVRLERERTAAASETAAFASSPAPAPGAQAAASGESADYISVKSPIVGVFYAAPAENAAPFVAVGDHVKKGQILCIIEAMKLMNEITAKEDGVIREICAANGQVVEYGTELFRMGR